MSTEFNFENWVKSNLTKNAIRVLNDVNLFAKWMIDNYECKMNRKGIIYIYINNTMMFNDSSNISNAIVNVVQYDRIDCVSVQK